MCQPGLYAAVCRASWSASAECASQGCMLLYAGLLGPPARNAPARVVCCCMPGFLVRQHGTRQQGLYAGLLGPPVTRLHHKLFWLTIQWMEDQVQNCSGHVQSDVNQHSCLPVVFTEQLYCCMDIKLFKQEWSVCTSHVTLFVFKSLLCQCPTTWNSLSDHCKVIQLLSIFC